MRVSFTSAELARECSSDRDRQRGYGEERARVLKLRLDQMRAVGSMGELIAFPGVRWHQLTGDRAEQFSVELDGPFRLICGVDTEPMPRRADGGIDVDAVDAIVIIDITDSR